MSSPYTSYEFLKNRLDHAYPVSVPVGASKRVAQGMSDWASGYNIESLFITRMFHEDGIIKMKTKDSMYASYFKMDFVTCTVHYHGLLKP